MSNLCIVITMLNVRVCVAICVVKGVIEALNKVSLLNLICVDMKILRHVKPFKVSRSDIAGTAQ